MLPCHHLMIRLHWSLSLPHRNGVLIDHYLTEVNGQNVIGLKDKAISEIFAESPRTLTITFMPAFVYDHMMKK